MDLASTTGFAEDQFVGRKLRIGSRTVVSILERDPRCAMISLDPDTAERNPAILSKLEETTVNRCTTSAACKNEVLVPTSATVPAAAAKKQQENDDDDD